MGTREGMIAAMESLLGTAGRPNKVTNWYGDRNGEYYRRAPWCDQTITWAACHSGNRSAVCFGEDFAYTVYHAQRFQAAGRWHTDVAGIRRGDIVFFDWEFSNHIGAIDHVGIVTGTNGRDILTIEGNTSNRCARRVRHASTIAGYGRPAYTAKAPGVRHAAFPGSGWFVMGRKSPLVAAMRKRLIAVGCGRYETARDVDTIGEGDKASYEAWQRHCGLKGSDAKWPPGKQSWDLLKVPL